MKVAFVVFYSRQAGGVRRRIIRVYNELCKRYSDISCDVIVCGADDKITADEMLSKMDCSTESLKIRVFNKLLWLFYLLFNNRYHLIHFWGYGRYVRAMQYIFRIKRMHNIFTSCDYPHAYNLLPPERMNRYIDILCHADYIDLLYPLGKDFANRYAKGKVFITPGTFTDLNIFCPADKEKIFVYAAARLNDDKDPILLIEAVELCKEHIRKHGYRVIILGTGIHEEYMKSYIVRNGLEDIIEMVGYQKTSLYLPKAEVFFSLQKHENYPSQSLAEAVACGCYSIITDVGDSRKCASEEFAEFVQGNPQAVSQAIVKYLGFDDGVKKNVVSIARQFALNNYSIENSIRYYRMLLEEAMKKTDMKS